MSNSFALSCISFLVIPQEKVISSGRSMLQFPPYAGPQTKKLSIALKKIRNQNPDSDLTVNGLLRSMKTLSSFNAAWVSCTLGIGVFVIWVNAHTLQTSSTSRCFWCITYHIYVQWVCRKRFEVFLIFVQKKKQFHIYEEQQSNNLAGNIR